MTSGREAVVARAQGVARALGDMPGAEIVSVRRHPHDWQTALYRLKDVQRLHMDVQSGGVGRMTAHPTVFGYVFCNGMIDGELAHSCAHGPPPHLIKVALPKTLNKQVWKVVEARLSDGRLSVAHAQAITVSAKKPREIDTSPAEKARRRVLTDEPAVVAKARGERAK